jgi:hypothetical protein
MSNAYSTLCDDFYLEMYVNTELDLPTQRDTILTFFERIQKQFPGMGCFYRREENEYCLEEDRNTGRYRWVSLEVDRIGSGVVNPSSCEEAYSQDRLVLELAPYMLGVSHLDIDSVDITFGMDFECMGSHDEVISEALLGGTAFNCLLDLPSAKPIGFSPAAVIALSEDCRTQARIKVESKTSVYARGKQRHRSDEAISLSFKHRSDEAISLSFTIRQYSSSTEKFDALKSFGYQCRLAEELMAEKIVPNFVRPLTDVITLKRLT